MVNSVCFVTIGLNPRHAEECVKLHIRCGFFALLPPQSSLVSLTYPALLLTSLGQGDGENFWIRCRIKINKAKKENTGLCPKSCHIQTLVNCKCLIVTNPHFINLQTSSPLHPSWDMDYGFSLSTRLYLMSLLSTEETITNKLQYMTTEIISAILQNPWVMDAASTSFLCASLSASDMAAEQGQILVIATAAVGGFTLLVILTLFFLITGR